MIGSTRQLAVYAYSVPADLRKGFDGLYALVVGELKRNPLGGDLFVFVSRDRHRAKVLFWDGTGLCVYGKRLERGRFACLWQEEEGSGPLRLTMSELQLFLEGSTAVGRIAPRPPVFVQQNLASFVKA